MSSSNTSPPEPIEVKVMPLDTEEYKVLKIDAEEVMTYPLCEDSDTSPFELFKQRMAYEINSLQKAKNSQIISEAKACGIMQYLQWRKNPSDYPNMKLSDFSRHTIREYASAKRMVLIDVPDLGFYNVLAVPKKTDLDACVAFSDYRRVIHAGQLFDVVHYLHTDSNKNTHWCVVELTTIKPQQPCKQPVSWSLEKRIFLVKEFYQSKNSIDCVLKKYQEEFGRCDLPQPQTIQRLVQLFEETGSVLAPEGWLTTLAPVSP
ncbi:hypothetical protein O3P69_001405 [Scylla paramamosain]|uniref:DUF4817 domain-containing protein n=1 Tax=Scylla paramamosain TaxID=85552 RepID=A0AAW0V0E9_SCYPA